MNKDETKSTGREAAKPAGRKRFRLEKLEERIAPTPHYNPQSNLVGTGNGNGGGGGSNSGSSISGSYY